MKKVILIQSRLSSSRFPGKMLARLGGYSLVEYVYKRCKSSHLSNEVAVITSNETSDDALVSECKKQTIPVYRGSLENVMDRYIQASEYYQADLLCRVCGDSPFVDVAVIDKLFYLVENERLDYATITDTLNGFVSEVMTKKALKKASDLTSNPEDLEHVTKYFRENLDKFNYKIVDVNLRPEALQHFTLTIDYKADLAIAEEIAKNLENFIFTSDDVIKILKKKYL